MGKSHVTTKLVLENAEPINPAALKIFMGEEKFWIEGLCGQLFVISFRDWDALKRKVQRKKRK